MNGLQSPEMELGSSSSSSNSPDQYSLNGLKFGKKIYFEDMGVAIPSKSGGGSSSSSAQSGAAGGGLPPAAPPKKVRGGVYQGGGQTPRCQVEGCKADLSDCKAYYSRHKVCGMHSKSPKVIVAGIEQRFCQQCSRFHLLVEFDQGKRSCRRRLAGHNERRRKPPAGSLLSPRYGSLIPAIFGNRKRTLKTKTANQIPAKVTVFVFCSFKAWNRNKRKQGHFFFSFCSIFSGNTMRTKILAKRCLTYFLWLVTGNNGKQGGFVMDFTAYPKLSRRDLWPSTASPEQYSPDQTTVTGKFPPPPPPPPPPWQSKSENLPPHLFLPGSANRTGCTGPSIPPPPADIFTGVSPDSSCALSLLSNQQPWGSRTQHHSSLGMNHDLLTGSSVVQPDGFSAGDHFSSSEWTPDLFLGQISPGAELEMVQQQNGRQYGELDSSIQHMHWSL